MMRLGNDGEIIATNGFDGGTYKPRYESRTSVFLGDMSKEDIRVKEMVKQRKSSEAFQDLVAQSLKRKEEKRKYLIQNYISAKREAGRQSADHFGRVMADRRTAVAMESSHIADVNPWVGSPFAGFGQAGEVRINPDQAQDIEIVDANISSVSEYGVRNWMEDPSSLDSRVQDASAAYTTGKQVLSTMVDYAQSAEKSVVGLPASTDLMTPAQKEQYNAYLNQLQAQPNYVKYGLAAVALWILFR